MINLSFSLENFETIFDIESRKRDMREFMPKSYSDILDIIKIHNKELLELKKFDFTHLTPSQLKAVEDRIAALPGIIKEEQKKKESIVRNALSGYSRKINSKSFILDFYEIDKDKGIYSLLKPRLKTEKLRVPPESFFMSKQLQYNLQKVFDVKQSDRYLILSQLKLLLNEDTPRFIVKTDITKFYESIPQEKLLAKVLNHRILDVRSKMFIKSILEKYEQSKDVSKIRKDCGVPRGVGISAFLSEIYMKDIDEHIQNYPGVIYYARYVDDIFIIMHKYKSDIELENVYSDISNIFKSCGLELKPYDNKDKESKVCLLDLTGSKLKSPKSMDYLGYRIDIARAKNKTSATFGVSTNKQKRIKERIKNSISYFNIESRYDIKSAKKILLSSLALLSGNIKLTGAKSRVKTGIYYSNALLDKKEEIDRFDTILQEELEKLSPYDKLFVDAECKNRYVAKLKSQICSIINFHKGYDEKNIRKRVCMNELKIIKTIWQ